MAVSLPIQRLILGDLVGSAYRGNGPAFLEGMLEGRGRYSLDYYMGRLNVIVALEGMGLLGAAVFLATTLWGREISRSLLSWGWVGRARRALSAAEPAWGVLFSVYAGLATISVVVNARIRDLTLETPLASLQQPAFDLAEWHARVISGDAPAPLQYRILTPFLAEGLNRLGLSVALSYDLIRWVALLAILCLFHLYLRRWFGSALSALGVLLLAGVLPLTYFPQFQYLDPIEILVFLGGLYAIREGKDRLLVAIVLVGTLNKESTILLAFAWAVVRWRRLSWSRFAVVGGMVVLAWLAPWAGPRLIYGSREYTTDFIKVSYNLFQPETYVYPILLFGPLWLLALYGLGRAPRFLALTSLIIPVYIAVNFTVAQMLEARLLLVLAPLVIPLALLVLEEQMGWKRVSAPEGVGEGWAQPPVRVTPVAAPTGASLSAAVAPSNRTSALTGRRRLGPQSPKGGTAGEVPQPP